MNAAPARRAAPPSRERITPDQFRLTMRSLAASVCVITSRHGTHMNGMTATAICSVSAEPPAILVAVNRANRSHALIAAGEAFAVNVLGADQAHVAGRFAGRETAPFGEADHPLSPTGCPLVAGCLAWLDCVLERSVECGSHTLFIGEVVSAWSSAEGSPLVYHQGRFAQIIGAQGSQVERA